MDLAPILLLTLPVSALFAFLTSLVVSDYKNDRRDGTIRELRHALREAKSQQQVLQPGENMELYRMVKKALDERDAEIRELRARAWSEGRYGDIF